MTTISTFQKDLERTPYMMAIQPIAEDCFTSAQTSFQQSNYIDIDRSPLTTTYDRRYMKVLDVLSYVGGIFPALFGVFFFMKGFGLFFFEMTFAYIHFKCKETRYRSFGNYIKMTLYRMLAKFIPP